MKTNKSVSSLNNSAVRLKKHLIYGLMFALSAANTAVAQSTAPGATSSIGTKAQNLSNLVLNVLDIIVFAVAAGAFIWMVIGILTKAQDVKQRVIYFVIGVVLLGLKSTIISSLMSI